MQRAVARLQAATQLPGQLALESEIQATLQLSPNMQALYQPDGGILASERCIRAHVACAVKHGAQLHTSCQVGCSTSHDVEQMLNTRLQVTGWQVQPGGRVLVATRTHGSFTCDQLVLTAGSWMPSLMPQLKVRAQELRVCSLAAAR